MATKDEITKIINIQLKTDDLLHGLTLAKNELLNLKKSVDDSNKAFKEGTKTQDEHAKTLADVEIKQKALTSEYRQYQKEILNNIKKETEQEGSLNSLRAQISNLTKEYNAMGKAMRESAEGEKLTKQIADLQKEVSEAEIKIGNFRSRVGSYADAAQGFTKLNVAIQQVVRETPNLTHSITQYFLAISNNLPMLADEIARVRNENAALKAQGLPTVSVIKQVVTSLFSWQTALVAGITLLTAYSDEILDWIKSLFAGKDAVDSLRKAQEKLHKIRVQGVIDSQEEITKLRLMKGVAEDVTRSQEERLAAIQNLRREYPEYLKNLSDEDILNGKLSGSIETLVKRIIKLNEARGALNTLVENEENLQLLKSQNYAYLNLIEAQEKFNAAGGEKFDERDRTAGTYGKTEEYKALVNAQKQYLKTLESAGDQGSKLAEKIREDFEGDVIKYIETIDAQKGVLEKMAEELFADQGKGGAKPTQPKTPKDPTADDQAKTLERLKAEANRVADETFKIYTTMVERTREEELRIFDETQQRKIGVISQRQAEINAAITAGVMEVNGKEYAIDEETKTHLVALNLLYEQQKTQLAETGAKERAQIEKKWSDKALADQQKANRKEIQGFLQQMREKERAFRAEQNGNQIEEQEAGLGGNEMARLSVERINLIEEEARALTMQKELETGVYSDLIKTSDEYAQAKVEAANRVAEAQLNLKRNEVQMRDVALKTANEALNGFSSLAGGFSQLAEALGADAGVVRGMAIAQSALGLAASVAQAAMVPFPGNIAAIAAVVGQLATIISQIKSLNKESENSYANGGLIPVSGNSGVIKGNSHASGGVALSLDGRKVAEVEGGELLAIVNKKDTAQLRALSAINSRHGRKFADGGVIDFTDVYRSVGIPQSGQIIQTSDTSGAFQYALMHSAMVDAVSKIRPQVAVRDISSEQSKVALRDSYSKSGRIKRKKTA